MLGFLAKIQDKKSVIPVRMMIFNEFRRTYAVPALEFITKISSVFESIVR